MRVKYRWNWKRLFILLLEVPVISNSISWCHFFFYASVFFNQLSNLNTTEPENYSKPGPIAALPDKRPTQNFKNNHPAAL